MRCNLTVEKEAQALEKGRYRGSERGEMCYRCDVEVSYNGGEQDRALADVEIPSVAGSRFEK